LRKDQCDKKKPWSMPQLNEIKLKMTESGCYGGGGGCSFGDGGGGGSGSGIIGGSGISGGIGLFSVS
jgi:hypothetical protein